MHLCASNTLHVCRYTYVYILYTLHACMHVCMYTYVRTDTDCMRAYMFELHAALHACAHACVRAYIRTLTACIHALHCYAAKAQ